MIGCAYHCRACNACFGSLEAFDLHRQFAEGHKDDWDYRICVEPMDDERFELKTDSGVCNLARPKKPKARIWMLAGQRQEWAERFPASRVTKGDAEKHPDLGEAA